MAPIYRIKLWIAMPQSQSSHFEQQEQNYSVASTLGHTRTSVGDTGVKGIKSFSHGAKCIRKRRRCVSTWVINSDGDRKKTTTMQQEARTTASMVWALCTSDMGAELFIKKSSSHRRKGPFHAKQTARGEVEARQAQLLCSRMRGVGVGIRTIRQDLGAGTGRTIR